MVLFCGNILGIFKQKKMRSSPESEITYVPRGPATDWALPCEIPEEITDVLECSFLSQKTLGTT